MIEQEWAAVAEREPRLQKLLDASLDTLRESAPRANQFDVYGMAKPLIAHLVGWRRGQVPSPGQPIPEGTALAAYARTVTPFAAEDDSLHESRAYEVAVSEVMAQLWRLAHTLRSAA